MLTPLFASHQRVRGVVALPRLFSFQAILKNVDRATYIYRKFRRIAAVSRLLSLANVN